MRKQKSKQAIKDGRLVNILKDENTTSREKQRAFDKLFSNHNKQVLTFFLKNRKKSEVAEDLMMITFEKVHEKIHMYKPETAAFTTWMYKIALHTMIDEKRRDKYEELSLDQLTGKTSEDNDGMEFQIESDVLNPEEGLVKEERIQQVRDAIGSIKNPVTRQLMTHRFIDDMSFNDIAKEMGVKNNSTLRVSIHREVEALGEKLQETQEA